MFFLGDWIPIEPRSTSSVVMDTLRRMAHTTLHAKELPSILEMKISHTVVGEYVVDSEKSSCTACSVKASESSFPLH